MVDLSDQAYHVFAKYKLSEWIFKKRALFHLRYSEKTFKTINDRKCFMNRQLLPVYFDLAKKNGLTLSLLDSWTFGAAKIHSDILSTFPNQNSEDMYVVSFRMLLKKEN